MTTTNKRRGRPSTFDKDLALKTAAELFKVKGFDSVGVAELSTAIGIKPPSLYAAFGNKHALFEKTLALYAGNEGQFMRRAFEHAASVKEGLRAMLLAAVEQYTQNDSAQGCMIMEGAHCTSNEDALSSCLDMCHATQANITRYIATEYPDLANLAASQIMIALAGLSASARTGHSKDELMIFAKNVADTVVADLD